MKLFLWTLIAVTLALAQGQTPEEFLELDEGVDGNDLDADEVIMLESDGTSREQLESLLRQDSRSSMQAASCEGLPDAYNDALSKGGDIFDADSASNSETDGGPTAVNATEVGRKKRQVTALNFCPHVNYLLRWFPVYYGSFLYEVCYVPWPYLQAITYARCTTRSCRLSWNRPGSCRPSCYARRRMFVFCYNRRYQRWYWKWVVRNLPQACTCAR